jgi:hypothetical protein
MKANLLKTLLIGAALTLTACNSEETTDIPEETTTENAMPGETNEMNYGTGESEQNGGNDTGAAEPAEPAEPTETLSVDESITTEDSSESMNEPEEGNDTENQ